LDRCALASASVTFMDLQDEPWDWLEAERFEWSKVVISVITAGF